MTLPVDGGSFCSNARVDIETEKKPKNADPKPLYSVTTSALRIASASEVRIGVRAR